MKTYSKSPSAAASAHTPGPWRFTHDTNASRSRGKFFVVLPVADTVVVCDVNRHREAAEANARLIAAAPELLDALRVSRGNVSSLNDTHPKVWGEWLKVIDAAITKAEGGK